MDQHRKVRRDTRLYQLKQQGLGPYSSVMKALDYIQESLSPRSPDDHEPDVKLLPFLEIAQHLQEKSADLQLSATIDEGGDYVEVELVLPDEALVDYFVEIQHNLHREDPLGARSFFGLLNFHQVKTLVVRSNDYNYPPRTITTLDTTYQRQFRNPNSPNARLRRLIDRALWGGERVTMPDELYPIFCQMDPKRQEMLTDQGLILMRNDDDTAFELFIPQMHPPRTRQAKMVHNLEDLAKGIAHRLQRSQGKPFAIAADSTEERVRNAFEVMTAHQLLDNRQFLNHLHDRNIGYSPRSQDGSLAAVEFHFLGGTAQGGKGNGDSPGEAPHTGQAKSPRAAASPGQGSRGSTPQGGNGQHPPVDWDWNPDQFPPSLWQLVEGVQSTGTPRRVPNRRSLCEFLVQPGIVEFLDSQGIALELPPLTDNGRFEEAAVLKPRKEPPTPSDEEGLGGSESRRSWWSPFGGRRERP